MKMFWGLVALLVLVTLTGAQRHSMTSEGTVDKICERPDVCTCKPEIITCSCTRDVKKLLLNPQSLIDKSITHRNIDSLIKFEVKNCDSLWLTEGALAEAVQLQLVHVTNVKNVTFQARVFIQLQTLLIDNVFAFHLEKEAFEMTEGLNNIAIRKSHIPLLKEGSLSKITNLQELRFDDVVIDKIEGGAVSIDMKKMTSKAEFLQTKFGNIEEKGLEIGNCSNVKLINSEIMSAEDNSIRISVSETIEIKGNTFHQKAHINSVRVVYNHSLEFSNNTMLNVDSWNVTKLKELPEYSSQITLDRLLTLYGGNKVTCKCISKDDNVTEMFKKNICYQGCSQSTVAAFLQSCQTQNPMSYEDRIRTLCKNSADHRTNSPQNNGIPSTKNPVTPKPGPSVNSHKSNAARISFNIFPVAIAFLLRSAM